MTGLTFGAGVTTLTEPLYLEDGPISGAGIGVTTLFWHGDGPAIRSRGTSVCRTANLRDLTIRTTAPDAACLELANVYCGRFTDLQLIARGDEAAAAQLTGTPETSTHYNRFRDCDLIAPGACVRIDGPANANQFRGGVWSGHGLALHIPGSDHTTGTNQFWGVAMQATGENSGGDVIRLGGGPGQVNDTQFYGCRVEAFRPPARIQLAPNAYRTTFRDGTMSSEITIADDGQANTFA